MIANVRVCVTPDLNVPATVRIGHTEGGTHTTVELAQWPAAGSVQLLGDPVDQANWLRDLILKLQAASESLEIQAFAEMAVKP